MAVYRIGREKGEIDLTGVRNITWDLRMLGYNTQKPLPEEIRAGLERRN